MAAKTTQSQVVSLQTDSTVHNAARLYYVDWLRVIATLGVFLFHASNVFNVGDFVIKNAETSMVVTIFQGFFFPWGMPLFFLIAGAGTWFALRRRSAGQYARERTGRLLMPFIFGSILFGPIQLFLEWSNKTQRGVRQGPFLDFVKARPWSAGPRFFGVVGYHMWFLGFLFCFSLLSLPLFLWFKGAAGQRFISRMARLCERRGGILLFILPLALVRLGLHPFFPYEHDWADFFCFMSFFILGYLLFADRQFAQAIRRDWPITLGVGIAAFLAFAAITLLTGDVNIEAGPRTLLDFVWWGLVAVNGWCWTAFVLFIGMRYLNHTNKWLQYGQEAILPFFVVHQTVIVVIAYFVVQWNTGMLPKMLVVFAGSFVVSIGLYELIIKRVGILRVMSGMKARHPDRAQVAAMTGG